LVTAQEELFEAEKIKDSQPQLFNAAKGKLKNWKLSESQVEQILQSGAPKEEFDVLADVSGYVITREVNLGDYISRGGTIYEIADLSRIWVLFDVYEQDIPWIKKGDKVTFTVQSLPGETFRGTISYLDPVIDPKTRVAKARVEMANSGLRLKPEMFTSGKVEAKLPAKTGNLSVPKTAVMWTGKRSVVYVKSATEKGVNFMLREVTLGPALGDSYLVESGLDEGEEIAVSGTFSIDAAAQLAGKPSMMNPEGGKPMTGHNHGGMDMDESEGFTQSEALTTQELPSEPETDIEPVKTDPQFTEQLTGVYEAYIDMKNAFVETNAEKVNAEAKDVIAALEKVNMGLLENDPHMAWMDQLETLNSTIKTISNSSDIAEQRKAFSQFNLAFYKSLKMFGLDGKAYFQYCPMANNDQGAYWFSEIEEIRNPYFGDEMLACGETREIIE
jgi:Cu(I)/Ag(I) efflux system membrane fusion protein